MSRKVVPPNYRTIIKGGVIILVPKQPLSALKGFATKVRPARLREKRDRF
ncbi:MAG: hypothetical protein ACM3JH_07085 [Acidithiobacillales bacterium]